MSKCQETIEKANNSYMLEWTSKVVFDILDFQIRKITHRTECDYTGNIYVSEVYYAIFLKRPKVYIDYLYSDIKEAKWDLQRLQNHFDYSIPYTCKVKEEDFNE
ncbi:MAG: hypothetical protein J6U54_17740 [Clostridiales bacterium]|nr:hypothetical protein [Clostridiales bacterium]